ncbi:MAG: MerR family transcriptional regulator [Thermoanaerobaculia bacterium]|nr:MerR family transcriptional regulator [Thermoanaerobaculia bacterium]
MSKLDPDQPIHSIGAVERRTGIKADLVRAWERRYGAVVPKRTETDRRLYSESDVRRLTLLREATRLGHRISHIARLADEQLELLLKPATATTDLTKVLGVRPELEDRLASGLAAIKSLDSSGLQREMARASFSLSRVALVEELLVPLLEQVGLGWLHGTISPAQEHMATAAIRSFVAGFLQVPASAKGPVIVITTPAGQLHELGALLAAAMAAAEGWRVVYLGPDLPTTSILQAAQQAEATAVAISITYPEASPNLLNEIASLLSSLEGCHCIAGGRGSVILEPLEAAENLTIVRGMADFQEVLSSVAASQSTESS